MTEHKTMNTIIHAAVRRGHARFDDASNAFSVGSRARADQLDAAWRNFSYQLHHHHEDEETIFLARATRTRCQPIDSGRPRKRACTNAECTRCGERSHEGLPCRPDCGELLSFRAALTELGSVIDDHLAHEGRDLEPVAVHYRASTQIKAAQKAVRRVA